MGEATPRLIAAVGDRDFFERLSGFIADHTQAALIEFIRLRPAQAPEILMSNATIKARKLAAEACNEPHVQLDPFCRVYAEKNPQGIYAFTDICGRALTRKYFAQLYKRSQYEGELDGFLRCSDGSTIVVCLAWNREQKGAAVARLERFLDVWNVVAAAITKHLDIRQIVEACPRQPVGDEIRRIRQAFGRSVLTKREQEVTCLLLSGYSVIGIAEKMRISKGTTKNYCKSIYRKLDIGSKGELFSLFFEAGLTFEHNPDEDPLAAYEARPKKCNSVGWLPTGGRASSHVQQSP